MPEPTFRGDPYRILGVPRDATPDEIKRRWRDLAREHHPDRAAGDVPEQERLTGRMARINAAYDVLRDPVRRARHDASPSARRAWEQDAADGASGPSRRRDGSRGAHDPLAGPPPPPPTRPVTGRFDTSAAYHARNATTGTSRAPLRGQGPVDRNSRPRDNDLRASTPTGPVHRRKAANTPPLPTLEESRATVLEFGRFHGWTLGDVADREPTYIDWIAKTITRDRDLVVRARLIAADLDERGVERAVRPPRPGFGNPRDAREAAEASA
jgi:curved DNA-binding protein CbpA